MAIIAQNNLFSWRDVEALGDLERLNLVLSALPDEGLMRKPEERRARCGTGKYGDFGRVVRVNSRLDVSFGFERHYIRGMKKMRFRVGLALIVMNAMALGRIRTGHRDAMRSLVGEAGVKRKAA